MVVRQSSCCLRSTCPRSRRHVFPTFKHLSDPALVHELDVAVVHERRNTAKVVALIAEVDDRKLYRAYGYPSIYQYCVGRLGLSEDEAYKRMQAAFAAESFPEILDMLADGRLHLTAVVRLSRSPTGNWFRNQLVLSPWPKSRLRWCHLIERS